MVYSRHPKKHNLKQQIYCSTILPRRLTSKIILSDYSKVVGHSDKDHGLVLNSFFLFFCFSLCQRFATLDRRARLQRENTQNRDTSLATESTPRLPEEEPEEHRTPVVCIASSVYLLSYVVHLFSHSSKLHLPLYPDAEWRSFVMYW